MSDAKEIAQTFIVEKKRTKRALQKKIHRIEKGIVEKKEALQASQKWQETAHTGDLLKANFFKLRPKLTSITVEDFEKESLSVTIALDPQLSPQEQLKAYYVKSKKQKRAIVPLTNAILHLEEEKKKWQEKQSTLEAIDTLDGLYLFQNTHKLCLRSVKKAKEVTSQEKTPFHKFYSAAGCTILVGKSARENDRITFQIARSSDYWLHISGLAGSHVIIRRGDKDTIDEETLLDAAHLAIYFSKARQELTRELEVVYTERKYVFRIKGAPKGKVSLSKSKTLRILLDPVRIASVKARKHPL